jgi:hypothetical protein
MPGRVYRAYSGNEDAFMVVVITIMLVFVMVMMSAALKAPDEETDSRGYQDHAHDMALLSFECLSKLQANEGDDSGEYDGCQHVADRRQEARPCRSCNGPAVGARDNGERDPMIGKNRMQEPDGTRREEQEWDRGSMHYFTST